MATLTVTLEGQASVPPEILRHLGVEPGQTVEIDLLPNGHIARASAKPAQARTWHEVSGSLAGLTTKVATIEEIAEASARVESRIVVISADTNVLVRFTVRDDSNQTAMADRTLASATQVVISLVVLCGFAWVLKSSYKFSSDRIASAIQVFLDRPMVILDREAVLAGLSILSSGGDFADGVIAYDGALLGAATFVSFDRKAVGILRDQGHNAIHPDDMK